MPINPKSPAVQKAILGGLLLAALLYVNFFTRVLPFTYKANAAEVTTLESSYKELSKDLNKARQATHRLPYLEKEYLLLHQKWEQSKSLLPEDQDMAWCLRTISLLGSQAGVQFTLFKPLPPKPAQYYTEHPIEIGVSGGYHEVGTFLSEVANLDRVINVTELDLQTPKARDEDHPVEASFVAVTYVLGGTGVAPEEESAVSKAAADKAKAKRPAPGKKSAGARKGGSRDKGGE
jgi:type IV pilus assembly protein PilO